MQQFSFDPESAAPVVDCILTGPKGSLRLRLVFDTGAHRTQIHIPRMRLLGHTESSASRISYAVGVGGVREKGFEAIVPKFFVLGHKFDLVPICAFDMSFLEEDGIDGLLGWDLIKRMHLEMNGPIG